MSEQPNLPGLDQPKKPTAIVHTIEGELSWMCVPHPASKNGDVLLVYCTDYRGGNLAWPITTDASEQELLRLCDEIVSVFWLMMRGLGVRRVELAHD